MADQADGHLVSSFRSLSKISGSVVILIGGVVFAGWIFNVPSLKSILPDTPQMVPNTALAFILTGVSLRMLVDIEPSSWIRKWRIPQLGAIVVGLMGILTLTEYVSGLNLGMDSILLPETGVPETAYPGRMSPHTAFTFILVSLSLLLIDVKNRFLPAQAFALGGGIIALLALAGHAYGVSFLFSVSTTTGMALHTAVSFTILCLGILFARPDQGFMALIASKTTGGFVARRFLPIAIAVPLIVGWLRLKGEQAGFYSTEVGLLLFATSNILILASVIWWYSRSLDETDRERKRIEERLRRLNRALRVLSECNQTMIRSTEEMDFLREICRVVISGGGYPLAWIGFAGQDQDKRVYPVASAGYEEGYLETMRITWGEDERGRGPTGTAIRTGRPAVCKNVAEDPDYAPWRADATRRGYGSSIALPLISEGLPFGALNIYAPEPNAFDDEEVALLTELAEDLAYGILTLRSRTAHTLTEQALRESEERFRQVVENIREVLWMKDIRHNQIIYVNPAYGEIWGQSCESLYVSPDSWLDAVHPIDRRRIMEAALSKQVQGTYEEVYRIMHPDGTFRWIAERAFPVRDASGEVCRIVGIAEDITERKMIEDQLHHAQKMEIIGRLAGGVAHDFNNILTAIIGYATLLQMKMPEDDPLKLNVEPILAASEKAAALTRSLLAFSRKQVLNPEPVNLNDIIRRVERLLLRLIGEEIRLNTKPADEDLIVMADSMQMDQVLMNLVSNARDAIPNEGLLTIATETVALDDKFIAAHGYGTPGMYALLSVTDTGTGMDEKTRERIFEPFFTTKDVGKGTGLGLALVYGIVKQHEGYITVYSEPGEGTTFNIYLPLIQAAARELKPRMPAIPVEGSETVLVAEDDATVRKLISSMLEEFGYTVIEATDGNEAIQKFMENKERVQLVILDVIMPHKSGKTVYDEIGKVSPAMKALFMSGYTVYMVKEKGVIEEEGTNFLSKPVSPSELLRKVREVLDKA